MAFRPKAQAKVYQQQGECFFEIHLLNIQNLVIVTQEKSATKTSSYRNILI